MTAVVDGRSVLGVEAGTPVAPPGVAGRAVGDVRADPGPDQYVVFRRSGDPVALRVDGVETVRTLPVSAVERDPDPEEVRAALSPDGGSVDVDPGLARATLVPSQGEEDGEPLAVLDVEHVAALTRGHSPAG